MLRFSIFNIPFVVQPYFWLSCVLLGGGLGARNGLDWSGVAIWTAVVFVSVSLHELGHAFAGRAFGARPFIALHGLGGITLLPGARLSRLRSIAVSAAGPAAGIALGLAVLLLVPHPAKDQPLAQAAYNSLLFVNLFWSAFNLLPILPLDGGQILKDALGPRRTQITRWTAVTLAVAVGIFAFQFKFYFAAILMGVFAYTNFQNRPVEGGVRQE